MVHNSTAIRCRRPNCITSMRQLHTFRNSCSHLPAGRGLPLNPSTPTASLISLQQPYRKHPPCIIPFLLCSKDKPEDLGFPAVEPAAAKPKGQEKEKPNVLKQLVNNVLKNPFIWGMALTYFFIYIVRQVGNL